MFGMMRGDRVEVSGDMAYDYITVRDSSVRREDRDINALASVEGKRTTFMVWNYHDLNIISPPVSVNVTVNGIDASEATVSHYRIDQENSNSYELWKKMGSPQDVSGDQYAQLEEAGQLDMIGGPMEQGVSDGQLIIPVDIEGQAVSLFVIDWN